MRETGVSPHGATVAASAPVSVGDVVAERYRVEARLGEGAMGVVYRVAHTTLRKRFALKLLAGPWASTPDAVVRFEREAIAASHIADPHVAQATDFGRLADGSCFLVLEFVDGRTLRSVLERGALQPRRAFQIARGIVSAMTAAHAVGVVHRDLKPENIMLVDHDGDPDYVKVLDFGIAKLEDRALASSEAKVAPGLTRQGAILGTPAYMSPEQSMGGRVDARSDLYAVGVILFEMLTGKCPFEGSPLVILHHHVMQAPPPLPPSVLAAAGAPVAEILRRLLAKTPGERFAGAAELGVALDECLAVLSASAHPSVSEAKGPALSRPLPMRPDAAPPEAPSPEGSSWARTLAWIGTGSATSKWTWRPRVIQYFAVRRRRQRLRAAVAWPMRLIERLRGSKKQNRLATLLGAPFVQARRLRGSRAEAARRANWRRIGIVTALAAFATSCVVVWAWASRHW